MAILQGNVLVFMRSIIFDAVMSFILFIVTLLRVVIAFEFGAHCGTFVIV